MNKNIGKRLFEERTRLHLTQRQFTKNAISPSQYSRVEHGEQDLRATDFLKLISLNDLDINIFLQDFKKEKKSNEEVMQILAQIFYDRDLDCAKEMQNFLYKHNYDSSLLIRSELITLVLENKDIMHNKSLEKRFTEEINKNDDWIKDKYFLQLFGSSMVIFDINRLKFYMDKIIKEYNPKIRTLSFEEQRRIAGICINYLNRCYSENNLALVNESIILLGSLAQNPDLLMYKLLGKYFKYLFTGANIKKNNILDVLNDAGYSKFILNLEKADCKIKLNTSFKY